MEEKYTLLTQQIQDGGLETETIKLLKNELDEKDK